jgi:hypothetical protein
MNPEKIGTILCRTLNGHGTHAEPSPEVRLADTLHGRPQTLSELLRLFEREEARENPDVTVALNELTMTEAGLIHVPKVGDFAFTDWSRQQAARLLGVRFNRWFQNATGTDRAAEMNRRLKRADGDIRLRTMKPVDPGSGDPQGADGILRAFVTPSYAAVKDSSVATTLLTLLAPVEQEFRILRFDMTDRTTSFVVAIGKPYTKGGPGQVGDVWGGLLVRNSGVGFASLLMILHLTRLLCLNGMTAPLPDALLLRRRHRGFQETTFLNGLRVQAADLPDELGRGVERLLLSEERHVESVEAEVGGILRDHRLPARLLPQVMQAYGREPTPSAFGISQALTFAAQSLAPEERLELEQAAGRYLAALK